MTAEQFKQDNPQFANLEGEQLWNAIEQYQLTLRSGDEIIKQIQPFWKTHTLRWLFYRKVPNFVFENAKYSDNRCSNCKEGVNMRIGMIIQGKCISYCPYCQKEYIPEPNTNLTYRIYQFRKILSKSFWFILDRLHLVRSSIHSRYEMFGDESRYVKSYRYDKDWNPLAPIMIKRKWYEYIFIEKPFHSF